MKLSIVIPCYNEKENLPLILNRFQEVIVDENIEVVLVDNGSTDGSNSVFQELLPQFSFAKSVKVEVNQGYGYGILQGLKACTGDFLGWTHADMQTDPNDIVKAYKILKHYNFDESIYVKGKRKGRSVFDLFFTVGMSFFETFLLGERLWDINAQPNIFHRKFYDSWKKAPHDFSLDLYAFYMARKEKLKVVRFIVLFPKRQYGQSKWNTGMKAKWKFIKRTLDFSFRLKKEGIE